MAAIQLLQLPLSSSSSSLSLFNNFHISTSLRTTNNRIRSPRLVVFANKEETQISLSTQLDKQNESDPQILQYVSEVKRVLELLKKNRDMTFNEVKLTIMIEDPRDVERRRLLGIDDEGAPTRDDLAAVLEEVNEGKIPEDYISLQMLAEEMTSWPNLEVESLKTTKAGRSLYAKATDTGIDPREAAKRLNIDWDSAAEIEETEDSDESDVPPAVGYGALYLVTAFPVIIGISVVLILFYNSLQ
ncbi:hypothetical protein Leryth_025431 [Lithospermum erythrorhizon]|nr:hypothetical protein Leryth_025431 [Lithospermum erythrorhizon]